MSFAPMKNATVTVARNTGQSTAGDPTYGAQTSVGVRMTKRVIRSASADGLSSDTVTVLATDEWEFAQTDAIWLPDADVSVVAQALNPARIGYAELLHLTLSTAEL